MNKTQRYLDLVKPLQIVAAYRHAVAQDDDAEANRLRQVWEFRHGEDSLHETAFGQVLID